MVAFSAISYVNRTVISVSSLGIVRAFPLTETEFGAIFAAFVVGHTLAMLLGGLLADRFGPRLVVTLSGIGARWLMALMALAGGDVRKSVLTGAGTLIPIQFCLGLATGPLYPACARLYKHWIPVSQRARVHGLVAGSAGLGGAVTSPLFGWLNTTIGWRLSYPAGCARDEGAVPRVARLPPQHASRALPARGDAQMRLRPS